MIPLPPAPFTHVTPSRATTLRVQAAAWVAALAMVVVQLPAWASPAVPGAEPALAPLPTEPVEAQIESAADEGRARPAEGASALLALQMTTAPHSSERREAMIARGVLLVAARQLDGAEAIATELDAWDKERAEPIARAGAMLLRARIALRRGDAAAAEPLATQSLALLPANAPPLVIFRHVRTLASIRNDANRIDDALRLWHAAMKLADASGRPSRRSEARSNLAYTYFVAGQAARATQFSNESIAIAEKAHDAMSLALAKNTQAIVLDGVGDRDGERRALQSAIDHARRAGAKYEESLFSANMSNFFLVTNQPKTAIAYAERALPLAREVGNAEGEVVALTNMGLGHIALHQLELGKQRVNEALTIERRRGMLASQADIHRELGDALERAGDTAGAVEALHAYRQESDAVHRSDTQKTVLAVQEQFDAEQRSAQLELLNRENKLKAEQLQHGALLQRLWLLLGAVFAMSITGVVLLYRRVRRANQALVASNQLLKLQSERDPLTGLPNRRYFQSAMRTLAPTGQITGTVCLIDVDHFKFINDSLGHAAGDAVLEEVARRLQAALREDDMIVRWGGEEFLVVAQGTGDDTADALAQRMLDAISDKPVICGGHSLRLSASIGFATFPITTAQLQITWDRAIRLVDAAMYLAKEHGRNRAYGVKLPLARDEIAIDIISGELEAACRDGQVVLTLLQGQAMPARREAVAEFA